MYQSGEVSSIGTGLTVVLSTLIAASSVLLVVPQLQALTGAASAASELSRSLIGIPYWTRSSQLVQCLLRVPVASRLGILLSRTQLDLPPRS